MAGLLVLAVPLAWHLQAVRRDIAAAQRTEDVVRLPIGRWLAAHGRPDQTVMLEPIGYIGYYSRMRVLDVIGLVSPEVLPLYRHGIDHPLGAMIAQFRPDFLCLRPVERDDAEAYNGGVGRTAIEHDYHLLRVFDNEFGKPVFLLYGRSL